MAKREEEPVQLPVPEELAALAKEHNCEADVAGCFSIHVTEERRELKARAVIAAAVAADKALKS